MLHAQGSDETLVGVLWRLALPTDEHAERSRGGRALGPMSAWEAWSGVLASAWPSSALQAVQEGFVNGGSLCVILFLSCFLYLPNNFF